MDIDKVKENIQPLITGRNASILQSTLNVDPAQLLIERRELEMQIRNYDGNDPLEPWCQYINWIEQSYPSSGKGAGLQEVLEKLLLHFENDERYYQDRRMVKLYIKLIENRKDPAECYKQLYNAGIGTMVADFYIAWAYCYDLVGNHARADEIFRKGIECRAEPLNELKEAHQHFGFSVAQRIIHQDNMAVKEETNRQLNERRLALSSLRGYSRNQLVSSVRTGSAIKKTTPGHVQIDKTLLAGQVSQNNNPSIKVFSNENNCVNVTETNSSECEANKSVIRCIVDSIREQENVKEPGPWTGAVSSKKGNSKLFDKGLSQCNLNFEIYAQDDIVVPANDIKVDKPFKYSENFIGKNAPQESWITPITTEESPDKNTLPHYNKCMLYPRSNQEFSFEEYKAFKWMVAHKMINHFMEKRHEFWNNGPHINCRLYPNFAKKSLPQQLDKLDEFYMPPKCDGLIMDYNDVYNAEEKVELQLEEILAYVRHMKQNQTIVRAIDMEETICEPSANMKKRRKSFYPIRKSLAPSKCNFDVPPTNRFDVKNKTDEVNNCSGSAAGRTNEVEEAGNNDTMNGNVAKEGAPVSAPQSEDQVNKFPFKIPVLPSVQPFVPSADKSETLHVPQEMVAPPATDVVIPKRLPFEIFEDTVCKTTASSATNNQKKTIYFDINETCSTQAFSAFLKPQSVSTPMAPAKPNPSRVFGNVLTDVIPMTTPIMKTVTPSDLEEGDLNDKEEDYSNKRQPMQTIETIGYVTPDSSENISPPQETFIPHLSPIMEISEQGIITTTPTTSGTSTGTVVATTITTIHQHNVEANVKPIVNINSTGDIIKDNKTSSSNQINSTSSEKSSIIDLDEVTRNVKHLHVNAETSKINEKMINLPTIYIDNGTTLNETLNAEGNAALVTSNTNSIVKCNQVGNFSRLEQKENTIVDLGLKQLSTVRFVEETSQSVARSFLSCQQDKTETIPNIKLLLNQEENKLLALENKSVTELMDPPTLPSPSIPALPLTTTETASSKMYYDDIFELFALSPAGPTPSSSSALSRTNKKNKDDNILTDTYLRDLCNVKEPPPLPSISHTSMGKGAGIMKNIVMMQARSDKKNLSEQQNSMPKAVSLKFEDNETYSDRIVKQETKDHDQNYDTKNRDRDMKLKFLISGNASKSNIDKENILQENVLIDTIDIIDDSDNEMSIYYKEPQKSPIGVRYQWNSSDLTDDNDDEYTHPVNVFDDQQVLDCMPLNVNLDPFKEDLLSGILQKINFTKFIQKLPNCQMKAYIPQLKSKTTIHVNDTKFEIMKLVAEGAYGTIFRAKNLNNGLMYALKQQKPPNNWEYYICLEIEDRLSIDEMLPAYMTIDYALVANNASVLITPYSSYGSFITVCNHIRKCTMKNVNEYVVMIMASELLDVMDHLHSLNIIHADIKADNFLLMNILSYPTQYRSIKLIDFGVAIDMKIFDPNQTFKYVHKEKSMRCIEMREGRPWTYQLDLYGLAGVVHVLLFGKYMEVKKTESGKWMHTTHVPRYFHKTLWETIFSALLNIRDCNSMPNLQELRALLKQEIEEKSTSVVAAMADFNMIINQMQQ